MTVDLLLFGLDKLIKYTAFRYPEYRKHLGEKNLTAQIKVADADKGRYFIFKDGRLKSKSGLHPNPDVCLTFKTEALAVSLMLPPTDWQAQIDAMKDFKLTLEGPQELTSWFFEIIQRIRSIGFKYGHALGDGVMRYSSCGTAGPHFVDVKDGKIIRINPIEFTHDDAESWTIDARGKTFTPPRKTSMQPNALNTKSRVYSDDRLLYPMKRVDFDPNGERNCEKRGISGYERVSWDEALDIVSAEIKRIKRDFGPAGIAFMPSLHHQWGNIGYYFSSALRFWNAVGFTRIEENPESYEGWYWGATHHWGHSMRCGMGDPYGLVEDCLQNAEMIVFWSSDPESTGGCYAGQDGSIRRQWAQELGIKMVHIDPYFNHTAAAFPGKWIAPYPGTSNALALAIAYVWINEDLYDADYVRTRTTGFEEWRDHILGNDDGISKTPEWAEGECGVPAREIRALAREWGSKRTYLGAGGLGTGLGGACRNATGVQWARSMICLSAMQGFGKPGVNLGNLQAGTPLDYNFYFPGYGEGGISGDLVNTGLAVSLYQRMPQLLTMNPVRQNIPRLKLAEAILDGHCDAYALDLSAVESQFQTYGYPAEGCAPIQMLYRPRLVITGHVCRIESTD